MNDNRAGGILLIVGSVATLITMAFHPHPGVQKMVPTPEAIASLTFLNRWLHGLAIASLPLTFLGALALTRHLSDEKRLSLAALVIYGFAAAAILSAACMSGFVGSDIISRMVEGDPKLESRRMLLDFTFRLNQAYSGVYVTAVSASLVLWSAAILTKHRWNRALAVYGFVLGSMTVLALFSGHLVLDVHGAGLVALAQAVWFITAGVLLIQEGSSNGLKAEVAQPMSVSGAGS